MITLNNRQKTSLMSLLLCGMLTFGDTSAMATPDTTATNNATQQQQSTITKKDLIIATGTTGIVGTFAKDTLLYAKKTIKNVLRRPGAGFVAGLTAGVLVAKSPKTQGGISYSLDKAGDLLKYVARKFNPQLAELAKPKSVVTTLKEQAIATRRWFSPKVQQPFPVPQSQGLTEAELNKIYSLDNLK